MTEKEEKIEKKIDKLLRKKFGELIKTSREDKKYTRESLASKLGELGVSISDQAIKSYEYKNRIPPLARMIAIFISMDLEPQSLTDIIIEIFNEIQKEM